MAGGHGDIPDRTGSAAPPGQAGDPAAAAAGDQPTLDDFRRRVDGFWGDPRTAELKRTLKLASEPSRLPPTSAFESHLSDSLAILESRPRQAEFRLQKSLTFRDGELISISGDERPLPPDERVLVVMTTTTVMEADFLAVETSVLVFEREA